MAGSAAVRQTLSFITGSAPGSRLVFTYVLKSVIERSSGIPGVDKMLDTVAVDSPWVFGIDPAELAGFLKPYRLELLEDAGSEELEKMYLAPKSRNLPLNPHERVAHARVVD